jgi:hypothetical protein
VATPTQMKRRGRWSLVLGSIFAALTLGAVLASGAELVTAEVNGTANDVTVTKGTTANFNIKLSATGNISSLITSGSPSTATVDTVFSISSGGTVTGTTPSAVKNFYSSGLNCSSGGTSNCDVTWDGDPTAYDVPASVAANAATPVGTYTISLSPAAGTTTAANPSVSGGKLADANATSITVHVVAPAITDTDGDGVADAADNCPTVANAGQANNDGDAQGDACDADDDNDTVADAGDNCQFTANTDQANNDGDAQGDVCDADDDNDTVADTTDNCHFTANTDQANNDGDAQGDACDADDDNDGVADATDNCHFTSNADQADVDGDGIGNACDSDNDNDGVADAADNCPAVANADQANNDGDADGDVCDADDDNDSVLDVSDNCHFTANTDQADNDSDAQGDACDADDDNDTVLDATDNCQFAANTDQANNDSDSEGDVCDTDDDNDTVPDTTDNCPDVGNSDQADADTDGVGDLCDPNAFAPTVGQISGSASVTESDHGSDAKTYSVTASDGDGTTPTYSWSITAGNSSASISGATNGSSVTVDFTDGPSSPDVTLQVVVSDGEASHDVTRTIDVHVANVAPTVAFTGGPTSVNESSSKVTYTYSISDPGADTESASVGCGSLGTSSDETNTDAGGSFKCTFPDGANPATSSNVTVQATDSDGDAGNTATRVVTVNNVSPTINNFAIAKPAGAACTGTTNSVTVSFTISDPADEAADPITGSINWGDGSGAQLIAGRTISKDHNYAPGGPYTINVMVNDGDSGTANAGGSSTAFSLLYNTSGILQPINTTGSRSAFKLGSTIPVKVKITDCNGSPVSTLSPQVSLVKLDPTPDGTAVEDLYSTVPDQGTTMRFTGSPDYQYIFNLGTKNLSQGDFKVTISEPTIAPVSATFSIKK